MRVLTTIAVALAACGVRHPVTTDSPVEQAGDQTRHYTIWLGGARVGTATETESWTPRLVHLERVETMRFLRGDAELQLVTTIAIDADPGLHARRVRWTEQSGATTRVAEAVHDGATWVTSTGATLAATAVPAELVPLLVRRDGHFDGDVFLPARNFVGGHGRITAIDADRLVARLAFAATGTRAEATTYAEATIDLDRDRMPARIVDGEGVIAMRVSAAQASAPFVATDLVAATAIPIAGARHTHASSLVLDGDLVVPALPGQAAATTSAGVAFELGAALPGDLPAGMPTRDRTTEIRALVAGVRARITPDLGAHVATGDAADATAGDCTTFALAYSAVATRRGIPTRVVTGLRVDPTSAGDRLVRHRWAVSWTGRAWIAVDAAYGAAPAGGDLVGLAVGDADDAGLVAGEAALAHVRAATWN